MADDSAGQERATHISARESSRHNSCRLRRRFLPLRNVAIFISLIYISLTGLVAQVNEKEQPGNDDVARLRDATSPRVRRENDHGPLERGRRLSHITLTFKRKAERRSALDRLLEEQQNPWSPNYHKWLTPEEFGDRFGCQSGELRPSRGMAAISWSHGRIHGSQSRLDRFQRHGRAGGEGLPY